MMGNNYIDPYNPLGPHGKCTVCEGYGYVGRTATSANGSIVVLSKTDACPHCGGSGKEPRR
jgi:DnaJ-class molecular chaperone